METHKGENRILVLLSCKGKLLLPLTIDSLQATYLHEATTSVSASYNLQGSSNSHKFSASYNLHEAPTSPNSNWKFIKTPMYFLQATTHRRLLPQLLQATNCKDSPTPIYFMWATTHRRLLPQLLQDTTCKEAPTPINFLHATTCRRLLPHPAPTGNLSS